MNLNPLARRCGVFPWSSLIRNLVILTPNLVPSILSVLDNDSEIVKDLNGNIVLSYGNITPYDFELQIATSDSFVTATSYLSGDVINYQNGVLIKGYEINLDDISPRLHLEQKTLYARVRTQYGLNSLSVWSDSISFNTFPLWTQDYTEKLIDLLPDENVYNKDVLKLPLADRNTKIYSLVDSMYAKSFDTFKRQTELLKTDIIIDLTRDEQLYDIWGTFFDFEKPNDFQWIEYRTALRALINSAMTGSTVNAIEKICIAFTGVRPVITLVRDLQEGYEDECYLEDNELTPTGEGDETYTEVGTYDDDLIIRSNGELSHGVDIEIQNPTLRELNLDVMYSLIRKILPAHARINLTSAVTS
jgi:hypothetical protein